MKTNIFESQYQLKNLIDSDGKIIGTIDEIKEQEAIALGIMKNLLGCSIVKNNKKYVIAELELYFGGIGDKAHDWYRRKLYNEKKSSTSDVLAKYQAMEGPIFYFSHKTIFSRTRCDIVIGKKDVAVSFLLRSVFDLEKQAPIKSSTLNVIKTICLNPNLDFGKKVEIQDTREEVFNEGYFIDEHNYMKKRIVNGKSTGFENDSINGSKEWNFFLTKFLKG